VSVRMCDVCRNLAEWSVQRDRRTIKGGDACGEHLQSVAERAHTAYPDAPYFELEPVSH
jgi:hypothetical protein